MVRVLANERPIFLLLANVTCLFNLWLVSLFVIGLFVDHKTVRPKFIDPPWDETDDYGGDEEDGAGAADPLD